MADGLLPLVFCQDLFLHPFCRRTKLTHASLLQQPFPSQALVRGILEWRGKEKNRYFVGVARSTPALWKACRHVFYMGKKKKNEKIMSESPINVTFNLFVKKKKPRPCAPFFAYTVPQCFSGADYGITYISWFLYRCHG